ncbi:unnamed protein product [Arabidopsis halleri]
MCVVRLLTLIILLLFASSNKIFADLPFNCESINTR